ncbi:MAG: DUF4157 domain-containing protein [Oscillospiraceae bacterium]|jgi:hypothetical protein|nr:DUF4157 domain-containing protein [Oscillospiraceae bacterium]
MQAYMTQAYSTAKRVRSDAYDVSDAQIPNSAYISAMPEMANQTSSPDLLGSIKSRSSGLQSNSNDVIQLKSRNTQTNNTGIPTQIKTGFEQNSGFSFDDVRVHYNSTKPAQLDAHAYTQGNDIHIAPGQEKHLGHELGHVVQQKQGRVKATVQLQSYAANTDSRLESEADVMSSAFNSGVSDFNTASLVQAPTGGGSSNTVVQMKAYSGTLSMFTGKKGWKWLQDVNIPLFRNKDGKKYKINHSHIVFDNPQSLPNNNKIAHERKDVGFGAKGVFSGFMDKEELNVVGDVAGNKMQERLFAATARSMKDYSGYNIFSKNCQTFIVDIINNYNDFKNKVFDATAKAAEFTEADPELSNEQKKNILNLEQQALVEIGGLGSDSQHVAEGLPDSTLDKFSEENETKLAKAISSRFELASIQKAKYDAMIGRQLELRKLIQLIPDPKSAEVMALFKKAFDLQNKKDPESQNEFESIIVALRAFVPANNEMTGSNATTGSNTVADNTISESNITTQSNTTTAMNENLSGENTEIGDKSIADEVAKYDKTEDLKIQIPSPPKDAQLGSVEPVIEEVPQSEIKAELEENSKSTTLEESNSMQSADVPEKSDTAMAPETYNLLHSVIKAELDSDSNLKNLQKLAKTDEHALISALIALLQKDKKIDIQNLLTSNIELKKVLVKLNKSHVSTSIAFWNKSKPVLASA